LAFKAEFDRRFEDNIPDADSPTAPDDIAKKR
jgi:hypothetical protein